MKDFAVIEDQAIAQELNCTLQEVKTAMKKLFQKQNKEQWAIISINDHYIFFSDNINIPIPFDLMPMQPKILSRKALNPVAFRCFGHFPRYRYTKT